jgi:hypothetical protein
VAADIGMDLLVATGWFACAAVLVDWLVSVGRKDGSLKFAT